MPPTAVKLLATTDLRKMRLRPSLWNAHGNRIDPENPVHIDDGNAFRAMVVLETPDGLWLPVGRPLRVHSVVTLGWRPTRFEGVCVVPAHGNAVLEVDLHQQ